MAYYDFLLPAGFWGAGGAACLRRIFAAWLGAAALDLKFRDLNLPGEKPTRLYSAPLQRIRILLRSGRGQIKFIRSGPGYAFIYNGASFGFQNFASKSIPVTSHPHGCQHHPRGSCRAASACGRIGLLGGSMWPPRGRRLGLEYLKAEFFWNLWVWI